MNKQVEHKDHYLFYSSEFSGNVVMLDENETRHACVALRLEVGDPISVTDGKGAVYYCKISDLAGKCAEAYVLESKKQKPPAPYINFAVGLTEKKVFEEILKNLAALGINSVSPVECEYCQKKWWAERWGKYTSRFEKTVIASAKQSLNPYLIEVEQPVALETVIREVEKNKSALLYADEKGSKMDKYDDNLRKEKSLTCFVGPPGGFSPEEIDLLKQTGAKPVCLSKNRLRTELAAATFAGCLVQKIRI